MGNRGGSKIFKGGGGGEGAPTSAEGASFLGGSGGMPPKIFEILSL